MSSLKKNVASRMRVLESTYDTCVAPGAYIIVRLDGRNFTALTKKQGSFERPFDETFAQAMWETTKHLLKSGFQVRYGYVQSDEISLLISREDDTFGRRVQKLSTVLSGECSAFFARQLDVHGVFDCRVLPVSLESDVLDYFTWRQQDCFRNTLSAWCYWTLRKEGKTPAEAQAKTAGVRTTDKNELLFARGINPNDLPLWQKRGVGVHWAESLTEGFNPVKKRMESALRRRVTLNKELARGEAYQDFLKTFL